jgi:hypothetical protein
MVSGRGVILWVAALWDSSHTVLDLPQDGDELASLISCNIKYLHGGFLVAPLTE